MFEKCHFLTLTYFEIIGFVLRVPTAGFLFTDHLLGTFKENETKAEVNKKNKSSSAHLEDTK